MHDTQDQPHGLGTARFADHGDDVLPHARSGVSASRVLRAFALTTEMEALIDERLAELRLVIPQLRPWRGRLSGRRVLGAHSPPEHGEAAARGAARGVTRIDIEFEVDVDPASPAVVELACHSTVRGRDRQTTRTRIPLPEGGPVPAARQRVAAWVEDALLVFAADWFEARRTESEQIR